MRKSLLRVLRDPKCRKPLCLFPFDSKDASDDEDVTDGILLCKACEVAYPITNGVPIMLKAGFSKEFVHKYAGKVSDNEHLSRLDLRTQADSDWSFATEWSVHFRANLDKTWGWTVAERVQQFFRETGTDSDWCKGKLILDAGCGNGQLSEGLAASGATVIAIDYSASVIEAERRRKTSTVHFVQGDLHTPPFDVDTFDLVVSNGVLHHTPDTYKAFCAVAQLVKPQGRLYLWLYCRPETFVRRFCLYPVLDMIRAVVSRAPGGIQALAVKGYALVLNAVHKALKKHEELSWQERVIAAYDWLTPRWRHYHTPVEVSSWFFLNGYSAATLTHWDNPYGFGMVARRESQEHTPGVNFARKGIVGKVGVLTSRWK